MAVQTGRDGACMHSGSRGRDAPRRLTTVMTTWLRVDRMNTASRPPRAISNSGPEPGHTRQAWKWADSTATMITQMPWKKAPMPAGMQTISVVVCHRRPHSTRAGIVETYGRSQAAYGSCCTSGLATHPKQRLLLVSSMLAAQHSSTRRLEVPCPRVSNSRKKEVETRCSGSAPPTSPPRGCVDGAYRRPMHWRRRASGCAGDRRACPRILCLGRRRTGAAADKRNQGLLCMKAVTSAATPAAPAAGRGAHHRHIDGPARGQRGDGQ